MDLTHCKDLAEAQTYYMLGCGIPGRKLSSSIAVGTVRNALDSYMYRYTGIEVSPSEFVMP